MNAPLRLRPRAGSNLPLPTRRPSGEREVRHLEKLLTGRAGFDKPEFFVTPGYGERLRDLLRYSQAVTIGNRVEMSGEGGRDDDLQIPEALEDGIAQAFRNVERTLATAGAEWRRDVHVNS